jgi:hypothetical protein
MCCFSLPVRMVSSTRIFARPLEGDRQLLVYGMTVEIAEDVAMILPIPVPADSPDDAVKFVDLSACPEFFEELDRLFPRHEAVAGFAPRAASFGAPQPMLVVHDVGDFEASFVPTPMDFDRLDPRFRLPAEVWDRLPRYHDWGFCVFKLKMRKVQPTGFFGLLKGKVESERRKVHPMAFEFPRRDASALFFPTVHVHDGEVHPTAEFDHDLYCQTDAAWEPLMDWERSSQKSDVLFGARAWMAPDTWLYKRTLKGELPNRDTLLAESKLRTRTVVSEHFRVRMCAAWEHLVDDGKTPLEPRVKKWMRVSEAERIRIRDAVTAELAPIFAAKKGEWLVKPFAHDDPHAVVFTASNDRIEPQQVHVAFDVGPPPEARTEIQAAVQAALDRASG